MQPPLHAVHSSPSFPMIGPPSQPLLLSQASGLQQFPVSQIPVTLPRPSLHPVPQITPYTPRFPTNQPSRSVFGEPVAIPGIPHGNTNRRIRSGPSRTGQISNVHRQRDNILKLEMILLPKDVCVLLFILSNTLWLTYLVAKQRLSTSRPSWSSRS